MNENLILSKLSFLGKDLVDEILLESQLMTIPKGAIILESGKYVKVLPLVLSGLVKVFSKYEDKELLLYYLEENETCIMSYMASLNNYPSKVLARTEEETVLLAIPSDKIALLSSKFPRFNKLFENQYDKRYSDLLDTINHLIFDKLDVRVFDFLRKKATMLKQDVVKITHKQIASELGTAREVVSRIIKKLEHDKKVSVIDDGILIL